MKDPIIDYYEDSNTFAIQLCPGPGVGAKDIAEGVIATFDAQDRLVGIELVGDVAKDYPELVAAVRKKPVSQASARSGA